MASERDEKLVFWLAENVLEWEGWTREELRITFDPLHDMNDAMKLVYETNNYHGRTVHIGLDGDTAYCEVYTGAAMYPPFKTYTVKGSAPSGVCRAICRAVAQAYQAPAELLTEEGETQ